MSAIAEDFEKLRQIDEIFFVRQCFFNFFFVYVMLMFSAYGSLCIGVKYLVHVYSSDVIL